jgi:hypothetical protein
MKCDYFKGGKFPWCYGELEEKIIDNGRNFLVLQICNRCGRVHTLDPMVLPKPTQMVFPDEKQMFLF